MSRNEDVTATSAGTTIEGAIVNIPKARSSVANAMTKRYGLTPVSSSNCNLSTRLLALSYKTMEAKEVGDERPFTSLTGMEIEPNADRFSLMSKLKVTGRPATGVDFSANVPHLRGVTFENSGLMSLQFYATHKNVHIRIGDLVRWTAPDPRNPSEFQFIEEQNLLLRNPAGMVPACLEPVDGFSYMHPVTAGLERFLDKHLTDANWWDSDALKTSAHPLDRWAYLKLRKGLAGFIDFNGNTAARKANLMEAIARLYAGNVRSLKQDLRNVIGNANIITPLQGGLSLPQHKDLLNASSFSAEADWIIHKHNLDTIVGVAITDGNPKDMIRIMKTGY